VYYNGRIAVLETAEKGSIPFTLTLSLYMQKICTLCKLSKDETAFHRRGKIKTPWCKSCRKVYDKNYHALNKDKRIQQALIRRDKTKVFMRELKSQLKCIRCGENHPACLDFHHRNPKEKLMTVGQVFQRGWSISSIKKEIEKCDILCSNCHRKLHWEEKHKTDSGAT
jgi:hypothetical protein